MEILVLKGSPNRNGSSNMLAESFMKGAREANHNVDEIDVAHANISPCIGCVHCRFVWFCR